MIGKGIPDESSLKGLIEMGYEIHGSSPNCIPLWPEYVRENYDSSDFREKEKWPGYIHRQRERTGKSKWSRPNGEVVSDLHFA